jgi:hypothetical protein
LNYTVFGRTCEDQGVFPSIYSWSGGKYNDFKATGNVPKVKRAAKQGF